jgi:NACalpha-BTF3-like transcription factor
MDTNSNHFSIFVAPAWKEEIKAMLETCLKKTEARTETGQESREAEIKTDLEKVKATELEVNQEEVEAVAEHQEVHNEEAVVETIEALEDRDGDWHLAVRRH